MGANLYSYIKKDHLSAPNTVCNVQIKQNARAYRILNIVSLRSKLAQHVDRVRCLGHLGQFINSPYCVALPPLGRRSEQRILRVVPCLLIPRSSKHLVIC